nr:MAG TPA: hypothetical protein [Caudoviricetes sp.]
MFIVIWVHNDQVNNYHLGTYEIYLYDYSLL